jgi:hypothetical protein
LSKDIKIGNRIFDGIAHQMMLDFDQIKQSIIHKGEQGSQREETLKQFLLQYLPKKYGIGSGEIINSSNQVSRQCDLVIYDSSESPLLLIREGYQLFPVESVIATIEVKSTLNQRSISEIVNNMASVKSLFHQENNYPLCAFFAYRSDFAENNRSLKISEHLASHSRKFDPAEYFDFGCLLTSGLFYNITGEDHHSIGYTVSTTELGQNLFSFFLYLLHVTNNEGKYYLSKYFDYELPIVDVVRI